MSLLIKKILQKIKDFETKEKIEELNVANLLENGWEQYYKCQIFKENDIVHIQLCVRYGTATRILTLPERIQTSIDNVLTCYVCFIRYI